MIWGAVKRVFVTEIYARVIVALLLATMGTLGLFISEHSSLGGAVLGLAVMIVVYRVRYGRW